MLIVKIERSVESQDMKDTADPQLLRERYSENSAQILKYENITIAYDQANMKIMSTF